MPAEAHRRLVALSEIIAGGKITQRSLASRLGVSLGLANGLLRELETDGLIAVNRSTGVRALRYAVTKKGRVARMRLAGAFAADSDRMLEPLRAELQGRTDRIRADGRRKALLCGCGPLADMAASAILNAGMKLAGIVSPDAAGGGVAGVRARSLSDADGVACDVAIALCPRDAQRLRRRLGARVPVVVLAPWCDASPLRRRLGARVPVVHLLANLGRKESRRVR